MYVNHAHISNSSHKINNGDGCQATILGKDGKCGEMRSLGILKEFQQLYEDKLSKVDGSCDCMSSQIKVQMLQDWVKDLTEQNTLLVQVVEELEHEASERVALLEDRLRHSSSTSYEIMQTLQEYDTQNLTEQSDILRQLMYYQSDISNLTEFIRRIREDGLWSIEGLHFYCVSHDDLCNDVPVKARCQKDVEDSYIRLQLELAKSKKVQEDLERETQSKELVIQEQSEQIEKLNNVVERCATSMPDRQRLLEELHELRAQVKYKTEEYVKLEQSVKDMREALTAEVAEKHDNILTLRRECQLLEEQCRQADKQTHFKDDIIKEMRKELKQFRKHHRQKKLLESPSKNKAVQVEIPEHDQFIASSHNLNSSRRFYRMEATPNASPKLLVTPKAVPDNLTLPKYTLAAPQTSPKANPKYIAACPDNMASPKATHKCHLVAPKVAAKSKTKEADSRKSGDEIQKPDELQNMFDSLEQENNSLRKTMIDAQQEMIVLHNLVQKYCFGNIVFEKLFWSCVRNFEKLYRDVNLEKEELLSAFVVRLRQFKLLKTKLKNCLDYNRKYVDQMLLLNNENREQHETITILKSKLNNDSLVLQSQNVDSSTERLSECDSDPDFTKSLFVLKQNINKMFALKDNEEIMQLRKQLIEVDNAMQEIENRDKLIQNKDEMIQIQSDTLNVAQREIKELREKIFDIEDERDNRLQEVRNLQQALKLHQSTIEELEKALSNSEEKAGNIQQTVDLYVNTIQILEETKVKSEMEIEQQRITIGNLQSALVSSKHQLDEMQGRVASDVTDKNAVIHSLYQDLTVMQSQYMECYGEIMKLTQTTECLRNANLDLKVNNFDLKKDIDELNVKLEEYKANIYTLEQNIEKILYTNEILENDITYLKYEMSDLAKELLVLQELLKITNLSTDDKKCNATKSLQVLQEHSETLVEQLKETQDQVTHEIQVNETNFSKIEELKQLLEIKTVELQTYESHLLVTKSKLDESIQKSLDYESKIRSMEVQLIGYETQQNQMDHNKDELVFKYNSDLMCLKHKVEILSQILSDKSDNLLQLHTELSVKEDSITGLTAENERLKQISKDEIQKLNQNIKRLDQQLIVLKPKYTETCEKYKKSKTDFEVLKQKEQAAKSELVEESNKLKSQLDKAENEEKRLNNIIDELKIDLNKYKMTLTDNTIELKDLKCAQEEILELNDEINKMTRLRNRILCDNQKLQEQIVKLNTHTSQFEERNKMVSQQLDKCLQDLTILQCAKDKLEERNAQLENEIEHLRRSYSEVSQEIRYKNESVLNLEHELSETKCSRDEISAESRIVLNNINLWLEEQRQINTNLSMSVKEKNSVIEELNLERNLLLKNIKDVCERYNQLSHEFRLSRQESHNYSRSSPPLRRSIYTWGSQGSLSGDSPIDSPIFADYDEEEDEPTPATWLRRVQSMSDELQKCNKYWKTEFGHAKKLKAVKDNPN